MTWLLAARSTILENLTAAHLIDWVRIVSKYRCTLGLDEHRVERLARCHKQPVPFGAAETEVAAAGDTSIAVGTIRVAIIGIRQSREEAKRHSAR